MCLVFLAFQASDAVPVMLGANREESRSRPSSSPVCSVKAARHVLLAGADQGPDGSFPEIGSWLGVNDAGLVVAVTNRRDGELAWADQTRSRGLLAVSLLGLESPADAASFARDELARGGYGGCNYLIANRHAGFVVHAPGARRITTKLLPPGLHCMTNLDLDDAEDQRIRFVLERLKPDQFVDSARRICQDPRMIIDAPDRGTVSSSLIEVGAEIRFYHIRGDPRFRNYERITPFDGV
jgi:uncharacterized protein with NRDE domain